MTRVIPYGVFAAMLRNQIASGPKNRALSQLVRLMCACFGCAIISLGTRSNATEFVFSHIAGSDTETGAVDGPASQARFRTIGGIAVRPDGTLIIADGGNHTVRALSPEGVVSTVAGYPGQPGFLDGSGSAARFNWPGGVAIDGAGNIYVTDEKNQCVRRIAQDGYVSTLAGGAYGHSDGTGSAASFNTPVGIAYNASIGLCVADLFNFEIRKVSLTGEVTTLAGSYTRTGNVDGTGANARFSSPIDVAFDAAGNLYVADSSSETIRKVTSDGTVTTVAGQPSTAGSVDGSARSALFSRPSGVAVDTSGTLFVADSRNCTVRQIAPDGQVTTVAGRAGTQGNVDGAGAVARFVDPGRIAVDLDGNLYVSEVATIRKGTRVKTTPAVQWAQPASIAKGEPLSSQQLNATANVPGTFSYSPSAGAQLVAGKHTLTVTFTPTDRLTYSSVTAQVQLEVQGLPATRLVNIATRAYCSTGNGVTIGGLVISGTQPRQMLIRAVGPSLARAGLDPKRILADPTLELHDASHPDAPVVKNDNWGDNPDAADIVAASTRVGASKLSADDSKSAALLLTLSPGIYTFLVGGNDGGSGIVLFEAYDADTSISGSNIVNIATRAYCAPDDRVTIAGIVVTGTASKKMLLRAVGPTLVSKGINAGEVLADPTIELHDALHGNVIIATNDDWRLNANAAAILATGARVGATPLDANDAQSAALLMDLQPGVYTMVAGGKSDSSGIVLVEAYDAD